jgi:hypothetical protein
MEIKIVGSVTDDGQIEEIESIAKIFAYEQRMKNLHIPIQCQPITVFQHQHKNTSQKPKKLNPIKMCVHGLL